MQGNRRTLLLGLALAVAIVVLMVARSGTTPTIPAAPPRTAAPAQAQAEQPGAPSEIQLEALSRPRGGPVEERRNPFEFGAREQRFSAVQPLPDIPDDQGRFPGQEVPSGPPPPPPITLKFIGIVTKADGTKIAVLSDGTRPISGQEGEEIEGRYKILTIGNESLEIAYLDGRGRQTIRLSGK